MWEVLWGWETQLFQTHSYQLLFFCREEKKKWLAPTPLRACTTWVGVFGEGGWDEVTMRQLLYSLHSVGILFTPELLCFGPCWKCAVQTTPDKCSVWLPTAQMMTPSNIPVYKRYFYYIILIMSSVGVALCNCCDRGCLFANGWKQHLAQSLSRPAHKRRAVFAKKAWDEPIRLETMKKNLESIWFGKQTWHFLRQKLKILSKI